MSDIDTSHPSRVDTGHPAQGMFTTPDLDPALLRVLARVRLRARRRIAWLHHLWAQEPRPQENEQAGAAAEIIPAEVAGVLAGRDNPAAEAAWLETEPTLAPLNAALARLETEMSSDQSSRLALLGEIFGLTRPDMDVFQACLALDLDPSLARLYAYLQDHAGRSYATEDLAARLFGHGLCCLWTAESPLHRWELVHEQAASPGEPAVLSLDRQVRDWLLGMNDLDAALVGTARLQPPLPPLENWPVDEAAGFITRMLEAGEGSQVRMLLVGSPGSGRRTLAACISARLGLPLLVIDASLVDDEEWPRLFRRAQRQAFLDRCALAWTGEAALRRPWPQSVAHFPVQFVICAAGQAPQPLPSGVETSLEMPPLSLPERRRLWRQYLPETGAWPPADFEALASGHRAGPGEIAAVARLGPGEPLQVAARLRAAQRRDLGRLAEPLECPFTWEDLVIPADLRSSLEDLAFEAQARASFWEGAAPRRLFPQGRGLVGLFTGPPGTGKTMAAQVIARGLGLDLFRIDLSAVVSKYVGETSQNLERVLSRAAEMDIVLLFDEADALFGRRTEIKDAHDRFANTDTNYLLQAIESYPGIALLATNKKNNLDPAFIRRIRYVLDFPRPDAAQRLRIWRQLVGELAGPEGLQAVGPGLEALANQVEATGAQIKFAVLAALFSAQRAGQPLSLPHLLRGLERELIKEGSALSSRDRERLMG